MRRGVIDLEDLNEPDPKGVAALAWYEAIPYFQDRHVQAVEYLIHGFIPLNSFTIFAGDAGHGKTMFTLALADAVSRGVPFSGMTTKQVPVLMSDRENSVDAVAMRVANMEIPKTPLLKI